LLLFCATYVLAGFIGREAWKSDDLAALGYMVQLAQGNANWWQPMMAGLAPESPAVLPYWLGAWALRLNTLGLPDDFMVRIPFGLLLATALFSTWYACYYLARSPKAQPVAFAFGGEASPKDYARALADGGLLALISCLGLAQLAHETTPALAQLAFSALLYFGMTALSYRPVQALVATGLGMLGLSLSGAPTLTVLLVLGGLLIYALEPRLATSGLHKPWLDTDQENPSRLPLWQVTSVLFTGLALTAFCSDLLGLWGWKLIIPASNWKESYGQLELLIWFTWPTWPLACWTLWQWRRQLFSRQLSRHLALPLYFAGITVMAALLSSGPDRTLLLALPPLASLAAFALPTLKRQVAALIDWFTLIFFSGCGFIIWVVWIAMQTGVPSQPAANVQRLAPGFEPSFSLIPFSLAVLATLVWAWLVRWRVGRHRAAIWKSLVMPAGGAALCWLLLMTLWMPLLNYAQSFNSLVKQALEQIEPRGCVEATGLSRAKIAALQVYGNLQVRPLSATGATDGCPWLLAEPDARMSPPAAIDPLTWTPMAAVKHATDGNEVVLIYRRH